MAGTLSPSTPLTAERVHVEPYGLRPALIRITHWLTLIAFLALLLTGSEILLSHPRFYWGETGNVMTTPLFTLPLPSSRDTVPTGYGYVLPDQNGWSRYLHFEAAWLAVITGVTYVGFGLFSGYFRRNLFTARRQSLHPSSYGMLQRFAYLLVIFVLFPLVIWTGLAMSPGAVSAYPGLVTTLGGQQSARTLHFADSILLVAFVIGHVIMVFRSGFRERMRGMITGRLSTNRRTL